MTQPRPIFFTQLTDAPSEDAYRTIVAGLLAYNQSRTGIADHRPLAVLLHDAAGQVIGGLWGRTAYGWLFTERLFVPEALRGQRVGTTLLAQAEGEARARGCIGAWLDTFEFQARGFYERQGYGEFGKIKDYPPGFSRYFLHKRFAPA